MKITQIPITQLNNWVGLLTEEQMQSLQGQTFQPDSYFNPIQDINDNWILSAEEIAYCSNSQFLWVKELDMIEYQPKPTPSLFETE